MPGHYTQQQGTVSSRYSKALNPRAGGQSATRYPSSGSQVPVGSNLGNFKFPWQLNQPGDEFGSRGERQRPATFDELHERQGQNLYQNFGAISRGEEGLTLRRDPITGQPIEPGRGQRNVNVGGTFNPYRTVPSFNIEATKVDVGGAQRANSQAFSALRQAMARGAIGANGNRLGARSGTAGLAAINQSAAPLFAAGASANASLQAGAAFTDQASQQAADVQNLQTRLFGVQGQRDMLDFFQKEAGQRADIGIRRGGLVLGREELKVNKEGQDLRAALEKQRLGILGFTAGEQAAFNREQMRLAWAELKEKIEQGFYGGGNTGAIDWANAFTDFVDAVVPG